MTTEILPNWNLERLYSGPVDAQIKHDLEKVVADAASFRDTAEPRFKGKISAEDLAQLLSEYEDLQKKILKPYMFAQLYHAADSNADGARALMNQVRETWSEVSEQTLFFELELMRLPEDVFSGLCSHERLQPYRHYLKHLHEYTPYMLSEQEERVIKRKDLTGKDAFVQLYDDITSELSFSYCMPGEESEQEVSGEELLALLYHPDGDVREESFTVFLTEHAKQSTAMTACFNNLLLDHRRECDLRNYPDIMMPTHLDQETDPRMIEALMSVTEQNYSLGQEYFALKKELLGLEVMKNTDIYAPLDQSPRNYAFTEAKALVLEAFHAFAPELGNAAEKFFEEQRIDVPPKPGKSSGAFCQGMMPGELPYVLVNYTGNLRDLSTLAHELGHGVHFALAQKQNLYHYQASLPFAETASVFGEMLLTRHLLQRETDPQIRIALLCTKLEEIIATTMRQNVLTRFELAAHKERAEGLLSPERYGELWWQENAKLFGEQIEMIEAYRWGWSYISHFIHARFYCTSYVIGELLVLGLYQRYLEQGEEFVPKYLELLARGGSAAPRELLAPFAIDLSEADFWQQGYNLVGEMLSELKQVIAASR